MIENYLKISLDHKRNGQETIFDAVTWRNYQLPYNIVSPETTLKELKIISDD